MTVDNPILYDIFKNVVSGITVPTIENPNVNYQVNFEMGDGFQVVSELLQKDAAPSKKNRKYPLVAVKMPVEEDFGKGLYCTARIEKMTIAHLTPEEFAVSKRYETDGVFKKVLYPIMYEFFRNLALSKFVSDKDPENFSFKKLDNAGFLVTSGELNDYISSIEIRNLEINLINIKKC